MKFTNMTIFIIYILPKFSVLIGYIGQVSGIGCGEGCKHCATSGGVCLQCNYMDGYWLHNNNCKRCKEQCELCTGEHVCSKCKANFWGNGTCNTACPENCDERGCDDENGTCYECKPGFVGTSCQQNCSLCADGLCDRNFGNCTNGCIAGYYQESLNVIKTCRKCSDNCKICNSQAVCLACVSGYYAIHTLTANSVNITTCLPCLSFCEECIDGDSCSVCKPGTYGQLCRYNCSSPHCYRCNNTTGMERCTECDTGYKLQSASCVPEISCSENCANGCTDNHLCPDGCKESWTGEMCSRQCSSQCRACEQNNGTLCTKCNEPFFTSSCRTPCSANCLKKFPFDETCRLGDGFCSNGCIVGFWGDTCNNSCHTECKSTTCNQTNGFCVVCDRNFYGALCEKICSEHCVDDGSLSNICMKDNGRCVHGCKNGYGGDNCKQVVTSATDNIVTTTSTQTDGKNPDKPEEPDLHIGAMTGALAGGGVVILAIVAVVVVCFVVRRNRLQRVESVKVDEYQQKQQQLTSVNVKKVNDRTDHNVGLDEMTEETSLDEILLENLDDEPDSCIITELNIPDSDTYYNMEGLIRSRVQIPNLLEYIRNKAEFESEFEKLPQGLIRTCNEALKSKNRVKNRYNGIYAYDATCVVLQSQNYINANYIQGYSQSGVSYIASLGPTKATMNNDFSIFWEMVWQEKTNKIIMLTNLEESDKMKCQQYWPDQRGHLVSGDFNIRCTAENVYSDFVVRELTIEKKSVTRKVTHYHYTAWPDKTVPDTVASLIEFRDKVEQDQTPVTGPMIVHCSAGIGRTGTYISLDILMREGKKENSVDIFGCVNAIRGQRVNLVQTLEQYVYIHKCVLYAFTCDADPLPVTDIPRVMTDEKVNAQFKAFENMESLSDSLFPVSSLGGGAIMHVPHTRRNGHCIDAVYLNGYVKRNKFIATETPSSKTMEDFLSLLLREKCPCVVSLDDQTKTDKSVADYVPPANKVSTFGHFKVECLGSDSKNGFTLRQLKISRTGSPATEDLKIYHYQVKGWSSSDSVPDTAQSLLAIIVDVEKTRANEQSDMPVAVHSKTGTERSSLFCVVSVLMEKAGVEKELSVLNTVCQVRARRRNAIKDTEQMQFCYDCVTEMLQRPDAQHYYNVNII